MLWESIFCGFWAFLLVFFANETGQRFSDVFGELQDVIHQLCWYSFPIKLQRILPVIIANAQQPIAIQFFGSTVCSRDQFKRVSIHSMNFIPNFF